MSRFDDYRSDMSGTRLEDWEIEQLLTRSGTSDDLADLEQFIATLSGDTGAPRDVSYMASSLAAVARASGRSARRGFRRVAVVAASMAMLVTLSGVAMAADRSAPGDALYGIDRALEAIGIGDGGIDERIAELETLLDRGEEKEAVEFLEDVIAESPAADVSKAADRLAIAPGLQPDPADDVAVPHDAPGDSDGRAENAASPGNGTAPASPPGQSGDAPGHNRDSGEPAAPEPNGQGSGVGQEPEVEPPGQDRATEKSDLPEKSGPKDEPAQTEPSDGAPDNVPAQDNSQGSGQNQGPEPGQDNAQDQGKGNGQG